MDGSFRATPNHPMWIIGSGWRQAGDIRAGHTLLDAAGTPVPVLAASAFNHTCTTYNLGVADDHSFFVLSGNTPVLAHNTNVGPRGWIIYQVKETINGVTYAYTGKASMECASQDALNPRQIFERRYSKTGGRLKRPTPSGPREWGFDKVEILHQFWEDGSPSGVVSRSSGRQRTKGEVTAQALEAFQEQVWRDGSTTLNTDRPLSPKHPDVQKIQDVGEAYLQTRNGGQPCAGVIRIH